MTHIAHNRSQQGALASRPLGVTTSEIAAAGIHRQVLTRLVTAGEIERIARGIYRLPGQSITEDHGLAVVSAAVPRGVVCLLSALQFDGIATQLPPEVWIAIDRLVRRPA